MNEPTPIEGAPSENALASTWNEQARTYGDCRRWTMNDEKILDLRDRGPVRHIGIQPEVISEFERLIGHPQPSGGGPGHWLGIQATAISVLGRIAELPANIADIATEYQVIRKGMQLMMDALDQSYDAGRFAREAGYGTRHFNRMFRHVAGMPPSEWFTIRKIQRARPLLSIPNILIKEVAAQLGYDDPLYFSRVFRRITGTSPQNYQSGVQEQ